MGVNLSVTIWATRQSRRAAGYREPSVLFQEHSTKGRTSSFVSSDVHQPKTAAPSFRTILDLECEQTSTPVQLSTHATATTGGKAKQNMLVLNAPPPLLNQIHIPTSPRPPNTVVVSTHGSCIFREASATPGNCKRACTHIPKSLRAFEGPSLPTIKTRVCAPILQLVHLGERTSRTQDSSPADNQEERFELLT